MSVSEGPATAASGRIELSSRQGSLELSVVASDFRPVAAGIGRLSVEVPPGIYQVVARAGPVVERKLIRVDPGSTHRDDAVAVLFPSPAPVTETTTSHEYHVDAAKMASSSLGGQTGPPSGLVIIVRDTRGLNGPPLHAGDLAAFDLVDEFFNPLPGFASGWQVRAAEAVATWSGRLQPGGYALRTDPALAHGRDRARGANQAFDQSIWLGEGWQTIVFITTGPGGPRTSLASVHMCDLGIAWDPGYDERVGPALELANWGLREGRSVVPHDLVNLLVNTKFVNPMLGIVGAHSLLLRESPDGNLLNTVLTNLQNMLGRHPDVVALKWMAAGSPASANQRDAVADEGTYWPPMLLQSYRALLARDAVQQNVIYAMSPAELAAGHLLVQGIWTAWKPFTPPIRSAGGMGAAVTPEGQAPPVVTPGAQPAATAGDVLPAVADDRSVLDRVRTDNPATARVAGYLTALAVLEGSRKTDRFATLTPEEIALATTLPVASVDRALDDIATFLPPSGPPAPPADGGAEGGGGGGGGTSGGFAAVLRSALPFLVATGLVLVGVAGALALCSGDRCVNVLIADATEAPTTSPTDTPTPEITPDAPTAAPATAGPVIETPTVSPIDEPTPEPATPTPSPTPPPTPVPLEPPAPVDFGDVAFGSARDQALTVLAPERVPLRFTLSTNPDLAFTSPETCEWQPAVDSDQLSCTVVLGFVPVREGPHAGTVDVLREDTTETFPVTLGGTGVPLQVYPTEPLNFGSTYIDSPKEDYVFIETFAPPPPVELVVVNDPTGVLITEPCEEWVDSVEPGGAPYCSVKVTFAPKSDVDYEATLQIWLGGPTPRTVQLVGDGDFVVGLKSN